LWEKVNRNCNEKVDLTGLELSGFEFWNQILIRPETLRLAAVQTRRWTRSPEAHHVVPWRLSPHWGPQREN
jgi:hypothetical protein